MNQRNVINGCTLNLGYMNCVHIKRQVLDVFQKSLKSFFGQKWVNLCT